jgi:hypothetical protein
MTIEEFRSAVEALRERRDEWLLDAISDVEDVIEQVGDIAFEVDNEIAEYRVDALETSRDPATDLVESLDLSELAELAAIRLTNDEPPNRRRSCRRFHLSCKRVTSLNCRISRTWTNPIGIGSSLKPLWIASVKPQINFAGLVGKQKIECCGQNVIR